MIPQKFLFSTVAVLSILISTACFAQVSFSDGGLSGQWYNPSRAGEGLFLEVVRTDSGQQISIAWFKGMAKELGSDGLYLEEREMDPPPGCRLRMHQMKSDEGAKLFGDHSVDAVFIDALHSYEGVAADINAW